MNRIGLVGLAKLELPSGDVRLCDGGFVSFADEIYTSTHPVFGRIGALEAAREGEGDEVPALQLSFLPSAAATPAQLAAPGFQGARARFWIGQFDEDAGALVGSPQLLFDGQVDQLMLSVGETLELEMTLVSTAERLFEGNIGNSLSDGWHQSVWPGELGHANATGLSVPVAWGAERPRSAVVAQ